MIAVSWTLYEPGMSSVPPLAIWIVPPTVPFPENEMVRFCKLISTTLPVTDNVLDCANSVHSQS